ncbi:histidine phosphatase family protein [Virgibacillus profundi]|uniref:Histidine phosphatase family protein n=1 Tax=Virgibacillus profundi TaxID=2024555 RepID=A0A2A2IBQ8_9BACI|nr:histidine phosphatase family protein [Virgibacillus profundi]PAV29441.1 histidine phosphatase family protein [Virgibacillus profundi]PXY53610.1 histidine phosphatase family protein [Virgibacillus profundi]
MKKIYFVRHCTADGQHKDSPLTTIGMRQAHLLSVFFSEQQTKIDKIISSPYLRAIESIKPYAEKENIEIEINDRLKERILSEDPIDDWMEVLEHSFNDHHYSLPGGESANDAILRATPILESIYHDENINNVILVSHGNLLALLIHQFDKNFGFDQWKELNNPDVYLINYEKNNTSIKCLWNT